MINVKIASDITTSLGWFHAEVDNTTNKGC